MKFIANMYTGEDEDYTYQVSKVKGGWVVTRWGVESPKIPAFMSQLNINFKWVNVLNDYDCGKFDSAEAAFEFLRG